MSFSIKQASISDTQTILRFIHAIADYEKLSHMVQATPNAIEEHLFGPNAVASCLLAYENATCVGFALYFKNFSTFVCKPGIYLEDLFVDPEYRGKGYGKALLLHLIHMAKENNYGRVEWSVLDWNTPAIEFYESIGAKAMKEWFIFRYTI